MNLWQISGDPRLADLGNEISDAIYKACAEGVEVDVACSIAVNVASDYWKEAYTKPPDELAAILIARPKRANPEGT